MEELNHWLCLLMNAPAHPGAGELAVAVFLAKYLVLVIPEGFVIAWLRGGETTRKALLLATFAAVTGLLISHAIGWIWPHPRPFVIGLGHTHMHHAADASFPSDHLTLLWSVAFSLLLDARTRVAGIALSLLGIPIASARIYLGVHFPIDMAGAALVALFSACGCRLIESSLVDRVFPSINTSYRTIFRSLIRRGWVAE